MPQGLIDGILGGMLIGIAVSLMLIFNGRVTGISGIVSGIIRPIRGDVGWRAFFIAGLILGGIIIQQFYPHLFEQKSSAQWFDYLIAGFLVGFGTLLGNGCTSGHGVCGISRLSIRSILSTVTFITFGILSVLLYKIIRGDL
jgi:uncharacterized membrane protein YedE/YeeE